MNDKTIWNYFDENIDYPKEVAHDPIPYGTVWCYISSTFLNGFINYVEPIKCYLIDRYTSDNKKVDDNHTKGELKEKILSGENETFHTKLNCFRDDIIILAEIETNNYDSNNKLNKFMFFYFDEDVSDCCIGRFETNDSKEEVIQSIINWLEREKLNNNGRIINENTESGIINYTELPPSFLQGWIKF